MTTKNEGQLSIDPETFRTRFLHSFEFTENGSAVLKIPIEDYQELGDLINSTLTAITEVLMVTIKAQDSKEVDGKTFLKSALMLVHLVLRILPMEELKGLDYLKNLAEVSTQKSN